MTRPAVGGPGPGGADAGDARIRLRGETLELLPERVLWWPAQGTLLVADAHFGKAASFRAHGVPVPRGTTTESLERLSSAVCRKNAQVAVFLGDFLHSAKGRADATLERLHAWRRRHAGLEMLLVRGNHDDRAGDPPPSLGLRVVDEPYRMGPFALCHLPDGLQQDVGREGNADGDGDGELRLTAQEPAPYVLCGHLHPAWRVSGRRESLRLPCFWFSRRHAVLPAFGAFTGGHVIERRAADRVFVVAEDRVIKV